MLSVLAKGEHPNAVVVFLIIGGMITACILHLLFPKLAIVKWKYLRGDAPASRLGTSLMGTALTFVGASLLSTLYHKDAVATPLFWIGWSLMLLALGVKW